MPADPRDQRIAELEQLLRAAVARIAALEAEVARLKRNSTNSSKPPSSDPPGLPGLPQPPTGKNRGGQPGHKGHKRKLLPAAKVNVFVPVIPKECDHCGAGLRGCDAHPRRHQVVDIPPVTPTVTEYQLHALDCEECGETTRAQLPLGVPLGAFGPRLSAMLAICTAKYRLSKRAVQELLRDFFGVELALGSVANIEQQVSAALDASVAEAREHVRQANAVNADETSWSENKKKAWLWVAATSAVTVFLIATQRSAKVAKELLGEAFSGVLTTDRWSAYNWVDVNQRQICWSHLLRDFQSWVDGGGAGKKVGIELLHETRRMFRWWHRVRDGTMTPERFSRNMRSVQLNVGTLLTQASRCRLPRVSSMATEMLKLEWAFWAFIDTKGVEPTNNFGERQIRHAVLWRKGSFGTDSASGSRFVERLLTTIATLRQQDRNVLEFVTEACAAALVGEAPPSLIPDRSRVMLVAA